MGGLAIYLEEEGLATTQISLIRIHSERTNPPRALWVPFELGRPLGVPDDAAFQQRVIRAALDLLDVSQGPIIVDYPEDVPGTGGDGEEDSLEGMACPIDLPSLPDEHAPQDTFGQALMKEIASLAPWYELAVRQRGRTTVGPSGLKIEDAAKFALRFLEDPLTESPITDQSGCWALKLAHEDIKAYYSEAISAQPGYGSSRRIEDWLYQETVLGRLAWSLRELSGTLNGDYCDRLGKTALVPDRQIHARALSDGEKSIMANGSRKDAKAQSKIGI